MHPVALALHPGALCEPGVQIPVAHEKTEAHSSQSLGRGRTLGQDSEEATPREQDVALDSDFRAERTSLSVPPVPAQPQRQ